MNIDFVKKIISDLSLSEYMVSVGNYKSFYVEATIDENNIFFWHNFGSLKVQNKRTAIVVIHLIQEYYYSIYNSSIEFRNFIGKRNFIANLYVFSGQMDFMIATSSNEEINWITNLEDS